MANAQVVAAPVTLPYGDFPEWYTNRQQFFGTYGPQLSYLDLGYLPLSCGTIHKMIDLCPSLEHLGVTLNFSMFMPYRRKTRLWRIPRAIPFVDIVVGGNPVDPFDSVRAGVGQDEVVIAFLKKLVQGWKHVRLLD